ncbi:hypothetical protein LTR56_011011 [Elasticomyces elasticus]|nr:hypothetical protein LTR22_019597 [Elasticomyces elasticus]KAK3641910.1 hypothetical protein LTR56_011011 [Elasticomyces elasticus]KAK4905928.1 hypothetical protein LTR49_024847 [Elasticomyces elasticus]KAK5757494.1 hypothetical protein LTS12_012452 [Elasticomyces elasticus]
MSSTKDKTPGNWGIKDAKDAIDLSPTEWSAFRAAVDSIPSSGDRAERKAAALQAVREWNPTFFATDKTDREYAVFAIIKDTTKHKKGSQAPKSESAKQPFVKHESASGSAAHYAQSAGGPSTWTMPTLEDANLQVLRAPSKTSTQMDDEGDTVMFTAGGGEGADEYEDDEEDDGEEECVVPVVSMKHVGEKREAYEIDFTKWKAKVVKKCMGSDAHPSQFSIWWTHPRHGEKLFRDLLTLDARELVHDDRSASAAILAQLPYITETQNQIRFMLYPAEDQPLPLPTYRKARSKQEVKVPQQSNTEQTSSADLATTSSSKPPPPLLTTSEDSIDPALQTEVTISSGRPPPPPLTISKEKSGLAPPYNPPYSPQNPTSTLPDAVPYGPLRSETDMATSPKPTSVPTSPQPPPPPPPPPPQHREKPVFPFPGKNGIDPLDLTMLPDWAKALDADIQEAILQKYMTRKRLMQQWPGCYVYAPDPRDYGAVDPHAVADDIRPVYPDACYEKEPSLCKGFKALDIGEREGEGEEGIDGEDSSENEKDRESRRQIARMNSLAHDIVKDHIQSLEHVTTKLNEEARQFWKVPREIWEIGQAGIGFYGLSTESEDLVVKNYQLLAIYIMLKRGNKGQRGSFLCDDVGLGKTLQALSVVVLQILANMAWLEVEEDRAAGCPLGHFPDIRTDLSEDVCPVEARGDWPYPFPCMCDHHSLTFKMLPERLGATIICTPDGGIAQQWVREILDKFDVDLLNIRIKMVINGPHAWTTTPHPRVHDLTTKNHRMLHGESIPNPLPENFDADGHGIELNTEGKTVDRFSRTKAVRGSDRIIVVTTVTAFRGHLLKQEGITFKQKSITRRKRKPRTGTPSRPDIEYITEFVRMQVTDRYPLLFGRSIYDELHRTYRISSTFMSLIFEMMPSWGSSIWLTATLIDNEPTVPLGPLRVMQRHWSTESEIISGDEKYFRVQKGKSPDALIPFWWWTLKKDMANIKNATRSKAFNVKTGDSNEKAEAKFQASKSAVQMMLMYYMIQRTPSTIWLDGTPAVRMPVNIHHDVKLPIVHTGGLPDLSNRKMQKRKRQLQWLFELCKSRAQREASYKKQLLGAGMEVPSGDIVVGSRANSLASKMGNLGNDGSVEPTGDEEEDETDETNDNIFGPSGMDEDMPEGIGEGTETGAGAGAGVGDGDEEKEKPPKVLDSLARAASSFPGLLDIYHIPDPADGPIDTNEATREAGEKFNDRIARNITLTEKAMPQKRGVEKRDGRPKHVWIDEVKDLVEDSPKGEWLTAYIEAVDAASKKAGKEKEGMLVFSFHASVVGALYLYYKYEKGWDDVAFLNAETTHNERSAVIRAFQNPADMDAKKDIKWPLPKNPRIIFSTYKILGVGYTLTRAYRSVLFDPPNTRKEETQAIGRTNRTNQKSPFTVTIRTWSAQSPIEAYLVKMSSVRTEVSSNLNQT